MRLRFSADPIDPAFAGTARRAHAHLATKWLPWLDVGSGRLLAALLAVLSIANIALCFPGTMMNDSYNQFAEAVTGRYTDWHPPIMAWLWAHLPYFLEGPAPLFVLHMVVYWSAIGLIADGARRMGHRRVAVMVALAGAFPPFVFMNANVIKDVGMAVTLLAGVALLFWHRVQGRKVNLVVGLLAAVLIAYGALVRTNAVFALGPLLLYAFAPSLTMRNLHVVVISTFVALAAIPASQMVNRALFHPVERHAVDSLFLFDIIGVAAELDDPSLLEPRAHMDAQTLDRCYTPFWWDTFSSWGPCGRYVNRPDGNRATYGDGLALQWLRTIAQHPVAYAEHRLKHFNSELFFAVPLKHLRFTPEYRVGDPHFKPFEVFTPSAIRMDLLRKNPSTWPVTWLVWGFVLMLYLARRPPTETVVLARALAISGIGYTLGYLVVGVATDFRYHYWSMLATVIATLLVAPHLVRGFKRGNRILTSGLFVLAIVIATGLATRLVDFQRWVV